MASGLVAGLSGLRVHQRMLDVIGNNLANSNTPGFKGSRATFSDILSQTLSNGTSPGDNLGGVNPKQVGLGVQIGSIDLNMNQGSFVTTGRTFDLAIQGAGFFMVSDGSQNFYTRSGTFGLDSSNNLVDLKNGNKVQSNLGADITIDTTSALAPNATTEVDMRGSLPAEMGGPFEAILTSTSAFNSGTTASLTGSNTETFDFSAAGTETMTIAINGGTPVTIDFADADFSDSAAATAAEVVAEINTDLTAAGVDDDLVATVSSGAVVLTTTLTGTGATIKVTDGSGTPAGILGLSQTITAGTQTAATSTTALNDMPTNITNYVSGDQITITGTDGPASDGSAGSAISSTFTFGTDGTTLGSLVSYINGLYSNATVALDSSGNITVTATNTGTTQMSLTIADGSSNTGVTQWGNHAQEVTTAGTNADTAVTSIGVFDTQGLEHTLTLTWSREDRDTWDLTASIPAADGTMGTASIQNINFGTDGSFQGITGSSNSNISMTWTSTGATQTITLDLGTVGTITGVSQLGEETTVQAVAQDGYAPGSLSNITVSSAGVVEGIYTNGQIQTLATLGVVTFPNPAGLLRASDTSFEAGPNSGTPALGQATVGSAGSIASGVLENSNVEVAEEFVKLVEAQRGFQSSARVIQTTDRLLAELNNLI